jgi:hypothetical protein
MFIGGTVYNFKIICSPNRNDGSVKEYELIVESNETQGKDLKDDADQFDVSKSFIRNVSQNETSQLAVLRFQKQDIYQNTSKGSLFVNTSGLSRQYWKPNSIIDNSTSFGLGSRFNDSLQEINNTAGPLTKVKAIFVSNQNNNNNNNNLNVIKAERESKEVGINDQINRDQLTKMTHDAHNDEKYKEIDILRNTNHNLNTVQSVKGHENEHIIFVSKNRSEDNLDTHQIAINPSHPLKNEKVDDEGKFRPSLKSNNSLKVITFSEYDTEESNPERNIRVKEGHARRNVQNNIAVEGQKKHHQKSNESSSLIS